MIANNFLQSLILFDPFKFFHLYVSKIEKKLKEIYLVSTDINYCDTSSNTIIIACCRSANKLTQEVINRLIDMDKKFQYLPEIDFSFIDSETCVRLAVDVNDSRVFLFQSLYDPTTNLSIDQNYSAFLLAIRTFKEWGARSVTGIIPYLAYARQNHSTRNQREPISAKLFADLSVTSGLDRLITFTPHSEEINTFYGNVPVEQINPSSFYISAFSDFKGLSDVILVAPDAGARNTVRLVSQALNIRYAFGSKFRPAAEECYITDLEGDFSGIKTALILDDMISSGGTIYNLVRQLYEEKGISQIYICAAHNLGFELARERLQELHNKFGLQELTISNSIPQSKSFSVLPFIKIIDISNLFVQYISDEIIEVQKK